MSDILKKLSKEELEFLMNLAKQKSVPKIEEPIIVEEVKEVEKPKEEVEEPKYPTEEQKRRYEERMEKIQDYLTPMEREEYFIEQWEAFWKRVEVKPMKLPIGIRMQFENLREVYNHLKLIQGTNRDDATFVIKRDKIEGLEYSQMDPAHIQLLAVFFDKYMVI
jgi:hypothetical protein